MYFIKKLPSVKYRSAPRSIAGLFNRGRLRGHLRAHIIVSRSHRCPSLFSGSVRSAPSTYPFARSPGGVRPRALSSPTASPHSCGFLFLVTGRLILDGVAGSVFRALTLSPPEEKFTADRFQPSRLVDPRPGRVVHHGGAGANFLNANARTTTADLHTVGNIKRPGSERESEPVW